MAVLLTFWVLAEDLEQDLLGACGPFLRELRDRLEDAQSCSGRCPLPRQLGGGALGLYAGDERLVPLRLERGGVGERAWVRLW